MLSILVLLHNIGLLADQCKFKILQEAQLKATIDFSPCFADWHLYLSVKHIFLTESRSIECIFPLASHLAGNCVIEPLISDVKSPPQTQIDVFDARAREGGGFLALWAALGIPTHSIIHLPDDSDDSLSFMVLWCDEDSVTLGAFVILFMR